MYQNKEYFELKELGYSSCYILTKDGEIFHKGLKCQLGPSKQNLYKLVTNDGKTVYRAIKPLYRKAFNIEYANDSIEDLIGEKWKPIDSSGKYFVSSLGRIKSYQRNKAYILKPYINKKGYLRVDINLENRKSYLVHQLVALAFIPNDNILLNDTVHHIDHNRQNNNINNLCWLSRAENSRLKNKKVDNKDVQ